MFRDKKKKPSEGTGEAGNPTSTPQTGVPVERATEEASGATKGETETTVVSAQPELTTDENAVVEPGGHAEATPAEATPTVDLGKPSDVPLKGTMEWNGRTRAKAFEQLREAGFLDSEIPDPPNDAWLKSAQKRLREQGNAQLATQLSGYIRRETPYAATPIGRESQLKAVESSAKQQRKEQRNQVLDERGQPIQRKFPVIPFVIGTAAVAATLGVGYMLLAPSLKTKTTTTTAVTKSPQNAASTTPANQTSAGVNTAPGITGSEEAKPLSNPDAPNMQGTGSTGAAAGGTSGSTPPTSGDEADTDAPGATSTQQVGVSEQALDQARQEGFSKGYQQGEQEGKAAGAQSGAREGYVQGQQAGQQAGIQQGYQQGVAEGKAAGQQAGQQAGLQEGYQKGVAEGRAAGEQEGYARGVQDGTRAVPQSSRTQTPPTMQGTGSAANPVAVTTPIPTTQPTVVLTPVTPGGSSGSGSDRSGAVTSTRPSTPTMPTTPVVPVQRGQLSAKPVGGSGAGRQPTLTMSGAGAASTASGGGSGAARGRLSVGGLSESGGNAGTPSNSRGTITAATTNLNAGGGSSEAVRGRLSIMSAKTTSDVATGAASNGSVATGNGGVQLDYINGTTGVTQNAGQTPATVSPSAVPGLTPSTGSQPNSSASGGNVSFQSATPNGQMAANPANDPRFGPYRPFQRLNAVLVTGVAVGSGLPNLPVIARTEDGREWIAYNPQAGPSGRVMLTFTELVDKQNNVVSKIQGAAYDGFGIPGVQGRSELLTPDLVRNLVRATATGLNDYAQRQLNASTTTVLPNGTVVTTPVTPQLWQTVGGRALSVLSLPSNKQTATEAVSLPAASKIIIVVGMSSDPNQR